MTVVSIVSTTCPSRGLSGFRAHRIMSDHLLSCMAFTTIPGSLLLGWPMPCRHACRHTSMEARFSYRPCLDSVHVFTDVRRPPDRSWDSHRLQAACMMFHLPRHPLGITTSSVRQLQSPTTAAAGASHTHATPWVMRQITLGCQRLFVLWLLHAGLWASHAGWPQVRALLTCCVCAQQWQLLVYDIGYV